MSVQLTTSLFILFGGIGPIFWGSMSDYYHVRRFLYLVSLLIFSVASVGCALVTNIWALVVLRCIQSVGTSVTMSVGAGRCTVSDCWEVTERGAAFSVLFVGQFFGPLVGPIIGGGLTTGLGWRSTFWFCFIYGLFLFWLIFTFLPETYREEESLSSTLAHAGMTEYNVTHYATNPETHANGTEIAANQAQIDKNAPALPEARSPASAATTSAAQKKKSFNPLTSIMLLRHMFVWMVAIEIGIVFGSMFTIETLIPELYTQNYGFASWQTGLSFLGAGLGNLIGSYVSGKISDRLLKRARERRGGAALAEDRITLNAWPGGFILIPIGLLLFGWPIQYLLTVWISIIGFAIVCFGMSQVYSAGSAYLVDCIPGRGASVTAACNLFRMTMACILSLIGQPVVAAIGTGFFMTILAVLNIFGMVLFVLVKWKGQLMRQWAGYGENIA
ncbi:major facilitator superfamily domain-containing protein [Gongronella butleri]|nr:major facilitator superfamily domain-containing protein [Gongronella butleri]